MQLTIEPLKVNRPIQIYLAQDDDDGTVRVNATDGETTALLFTIAPSGRAYIVRNYRNELATLGFQTQCDGQEIETM